MPKLLATLQKTEIVNADGRAIGWRLTWENFDIPDGVTPTQDNFEPVDNLARIPGWEEGA